MDSVNENVHSCISQMKRSQAVLCQGSDSTTRFWVFTRLSYFSIYLLLSVFQHYWYLHALLHIKKDAWAVLEGACNTQKHSTCGCFLSFQNSWRVDGAGQGGLPSLQGLLCGCRVPPRVGYSAGFGAGAAAVLSEGESITQGDLPGVTKFSWRWTPTKSKVRVAPGCVIYLIVCAWTHRYVHAGKPYKNVKHIYEVWCKRQFCQWIKDLKIKHIWQVPVPTCQLGREKGDQGNVIKHF